MSFFYVCFYPPAVAHRSQLWHSRQLHQDSLCLHHTSNAEGYTYVTRDTGTPPDCRFWSLWREEVTEEHFNRLVDCYWPIRKKMAFTPENSLFSYGEKNTFLSLYYYLFNVVIPSTKLHSAPLKPLHFSLTCQCFSPYCTSVMCKIDTSIQIKALAERVSQHRQIRFVHTEPQNVLPPTYLWCLTYQH